MKIIFKRKAAEGAIPSLSPGEPVVYRDQLLLGSLGANSGGEASVAGTAVVPRGVMHTPSAVSAQTLALGDALQIDLTDYACASPVDGMLFAFKLPQSIGTEGAAVRINSSALLPLVWSDSALVKSIGASSYIIGVFNSSMAGTVTIGGESYTSLNGAVQVITATDNNPVTVYWNDVQNKPNIQTVQMQVTFTDQSTATYNVCHIPAQQ